MNRRSAAVGLAAALAACTTPATMPWQDRKPALTAHVWRWTETLSSDGTRIRPPAPERYTLEFLSDGATRVRADCNTGSGRYQTTGERQLTLGRLAVTQAACLQGSLGDPYLRGLANVAGYRFDGDDLVLLLAHDRGTMRFVPLKR